MLSERKNGTYLLPACTSFEMDGSRTASNRSLQWGEQIVKPVFESKNDYDMMYLLARKLGFADQMFKNIKVENGAVSAEDILREINRGGWSTGYCGQSPERLKAHMRNQAKFDLVTLRAPKDDPEVGGDYYGLPWPCWGTPEFRHPGTPMLYNTNLPVKEGGGTFRARFGVERVVKRKVMENGQEVEKEVHDNLLAEGSYSVGSEIKDGYPEFTLGVLKKLGWDKDLTAQEMAIIQRVNPANPDAVSWSTRPFRRHPARGDRARLLALRQRQGAHDRLESAGSDPGPSRTDLYAAARSRRQISDAAGRQAVPRTQYRLYRAEGRRRQGHRQAVSADPEFRPAGRIRGRRRGDALEQVARRVEAGHVRRDQSGGCGRARHQGRRLGLGDRGRRASSKARMKALVTERVGKGVAWMPFHFAGWFEGVDLRSKYPKGADPIVLGESVNTLTTYGYDPATGMQEPKATLCQIRAA